MAIGPLNYTKSQKISECQRQLALPLALGVRRTPERVLTILSPTLK